MYCIYAYLYFILSMKYEYFNYPVFRKTFNCNKRHRERIEMGETSLGNGNLILFLLLCAECSAIKNRVKNFNYH